jgi:tetratricopeptide (TPR) repeat protein/predicted Ser/Thr protein kinase
MDEKKPRPDASAPKKPDAPGAGTRYAGESSSSNAPIAPDSTPHDPEATIIDVGFSTPDPGATMLDMDATLVPGMLAPQSPTPKSPAPARRPMSGMFVSAAVLQIGDVLGERYEILELLGEGGMGAVYKSSDRELGRPVALKVIRPELASNPAILARFKQELLLAHQVTHRNAVRVYDLGEAAGVKFITMEFVEGSDLRSLLLKQGKFAPEEAVEIVKQVCLALEAAHGVGVIHRDLKPQNVMRDKQGRILVMDFGLARSLESEGMTQTGALVGTMEYMSPEQALGKELDQRSDIFAVGLIFYELLTGKMPYKADTALASLLKRSQERAIPASEIDASVPKGLSDIVSKCLERDVNYRYANVREILTDLEAWQGKRPVMASMAGALQAPGSTVIAPPVPKKLPWKWIGTAAVALALGVGGWFLRNNLAVGTGTKAVKGPVNSLAVLPFRNASGDPGLDWIGSNLSELLPNDIGQSASLRTVSADRLHQVLSDLRFTNDSTLDPGTLKNIAVNSSAQTLIWGQFTRSNGRIRVDAKLQDFKRGNNIIPLDVEAASEKELPAAIDQLAQKIRENLALSPEIVKELQQQAFRPSSSSVDALRAYNEGLDLMRQGKNLEAQKKFEAAIQADDQFALAFARLGQAYSNQGYDTEAEKYSRQAVNLSQKLPMFERYFITATNARISGDAEKAIESYANLEKAAPQDPDIQFALGGLYETNNDFDKATQHYSKALEQDPKYVDALLARGRVQIKAGRPLDSLDDLNKAQSLATIQGNQVERAAILHAIGVAYRLSNKPQDALNNYKQSLDLKKELGDKRGIAVSLNESAQVHVMLGQVREAESNYKEALQIRQEIGDRRGYADTLMDLGNFYGDRGQQDEALKLYKQALLIQRGELKNELEQARLLNNIGTSYFSKGQYEDALTNYTQALQMREKLKVPEDVAETVRNLAATNTKLGQFDEALKQYLKALETWRSSGDTRDAAIASYDMGTVFQYQGRYGAALKAREDALKTFRDLKDRSFWMAEILSGYGLSLAQVGRGDDAKQSLDQAMTLAKELGNQGLIAQVQLYSGKAAFYRGDLKAARALCDQALASATKGKDPEKILAAKVAIARADALQGRGSSAIKNLVQQADSQGLKFEAVQASLDLGEALLKGKSIPAARQELDRALTRAQKFGLGSLEARANYLLGLAAQQSGDTKQSTQYFRQALSRWDDEQKEASSQSFLNRADLAQMYNDAQKQVSGK